MRVRIDKSGHQHPACAIYNFAIPGNETFDLLAAADGFDSIAAHEEAPIFSDRKLTKIAAGAGPSRTRQRNDL
jgi:hypothetical protein